MNITTSQIVNPGTEAGDKPDAVKIEIAGVTVLVNLHSGITTIDGSEHITTDEGENNTLEIHVCPAPPAFIKEMLDGLGDLDMTELIPGGLGLRIGLMDTTGLGDLGDLLAQGGFRIR